MIYTVYRIVRFGIEFHKWRRYGGGWNIPYRVYLWSALRKPYDTCYGFFTIRGEHR